MQQTPVYLDRDLSQLAFYQRILAEAADESVPLVERLVFLGIFSGNVDEFHRTRLARIEEALGKLRGREKKKDKIETLLASHAALDAELTELYADFDRSYKKLWTELKKKKVILLDEKSLSEEQGRFVRHYFQEKVRQNITPILLEHLHRTDYLRYRSPYLVVEVRSSTDPSKIRHALIEVPTGDLPRFLTLPPGPKGETCLLFLDDVFRYCLDELFATFGFDSFDAWSIQFTRDEDVEFDKDRKNYLADIKRGVRTRKDGNVVRLVYDKRMPSELRDRIAGIFDIHETRILKKGGKYHHLDDLVSLSDLPLPEDLFYPPMPVIPCAGLSGGGSIFDVIRRRDVLLNYPYQSFQNIIDMLLQASVDPKVSAIKMTIYRAAKNSRVINALINAARNEKDVTVYVEFQASFDEEANINWAELLAAEGIRTVYYAPGGLKVHSKLLLVRRKEDGETVDYTAIGTGNPNEKTSRIYCDHHLLTADKRLTSDVGKVFDLLESKKLKEPRFKSLVVSPFATRLTFMDLFDREIRNARQGRDAWAVIKLNNLGDRTIVDKMYEASQAGVNIRCIIRGICILVPGVKGLSDNISAVRIVDRFLEHARVMVFANDDRPEYFIGSSDWMGRNFDKRVEVTTPVYDPAVREELMRMLEIQLSDNVKANPIPRSPAIPVSKTKVRSQYAIHEMLEEKNRCGRD